MKTYLIKEIGGIGFNLGWFSGENWSIEFIICRSYGNFVDYITIKVFKFVFSFYSIKE